LEDRAVPATFYVNTTLDDVTPNNGKFSLREAIDKANLTSSADVIVLPAGVHKISLANPDGATDDVNATGDFDITGPLTIVGKGAGLTKIDAANLDRVFHVIGTADAPINVNFRGLTITGGGEVLDGAGILMKHANVTLRGCVVTKNTSGWSGGGISNLTDHTLCNLTLIGSTVSYNESLFADGGGIYVDNGKVTAWRSTITGNRAGANGGGIAGDKVALTLCTVSWNVAVQHTGGVGATKVNLTNSVIRDNRAGGNGGGVYGGAEGLTLVKSTVLRNMAGGDGGGAFIVDGELTASGSTVRGNHAERDGGGLYTGTATLTGVVVDGNAAVRYGGGVYAGLTGTLTGSTVSDNHSDDAGGGIYASDAILNRSTVSGNYTDTSDSLGGGIYAITTTLTSSTVRGNRGFTGGGIYAVTANLTYSTVSGNYTDISGTNYVDVNDGPGGGIFATTVNLINSTVSGNRGRSGGGIRATETANLTNSTVSGNHSDGINSVGGGIYAKTANLTNCTVSGNHTDDSGGGVFAQAGTFVNVTIAENSAGRGAGGVFVARPLAGLPFRVKNTIIALNRVAFDGVGPDVFCSGDKVESQGHNLIGIDNSTNGFNPTADFLGSLDNPLDPLLGELRYNGGKTQSYALLLGSPAIDAGDDDGAPAFDQRGIRRPRDGNGDGKRFVDIGAFER
jgi:CSLREA domain-containing protein